MPLKKKKNSFYGLNVFFFKFTFSLYFSFLAKEPINSKLIKIKIKVYSVSHIS